MSPQNSNSSRATIVSVGTERETEESNAGKGHLICQGGRGGAAEEAAQEAAKVAAEGPQGRHGGAATPIRLTPLCSHK